MWSRIIYKDDNQFIQDLSVITDQNPEAYTHQIAEGLFEELRLQNNYKKFSVSLPGNFNDLDAAEKSFFDDYSSAIPEKFLKLNLLIRPYEDFCRTCIITDEEIDQLVQMDLERYCKKLPDRAVSIRREKTASSRILFSNESFIKAFPDLQRLLLQLNLLIPVQLKKTGFEIIRTEEVAEINLAMIKRLARTIHSRYLHEIRNQISKEARRENLYFFYPGNQAGIEYTSDFDDLPDDIKFSNIDNALHIPTKLLAIGYKIRQVKKGYKAVTLHLNNDEIETMARVEHLRWSWEKRLAGWIFDNIKDEVRKTHPSLIPYADLSESEKEKDRELVKLIPALLQDIDYEAYPVSPNRIKKLSYAIKSQGIIQKILDETRELNAQIRELITISPDIEEMVTARNKKIEEAMEEIEGSYKYAQHIQATFLPDDLFIRECFPESFILFKPKDIVSGDFYFFSRQDNLMIFAAADCTGHGIPGALLSTLGYGMLDQAVNEIKLTDTNYILYHLYLKIHRFLRNDTEGTGLSDDMDIVLCILDMRTYILTYAGVKNPLYHITNGELIEYKANNSSEDCNTDEECRFSSDSIQLSMGDTIYLCSDGYIDQFGGKNHKKFQSARFKKLLKSISEYPMPEQSDLLYEEIEQWRSEKQEEQTDDILVIGIRIL
jgi:serine phosphatase RsbU (regulator of sigma subunit)